MASPKVNQYEFGRDYGSESGGGYNPNQCGEETKLYALELVSFTVCDVGGQDKLDHCEDVLSSLVIISFYAISHLTNSHLYIYIIY